MSTDATLLIDCTSLEQSLDFGARLGKKLRGKEVIELVSDLGGGKTTFVKGIARGIGSKDLVTSPTFTLSNLYQGTELQLHHFDFYRLNEPGIMREELAEVLSDSQAVTVVEWANIVEDVLPPERLTITITAIGETSRRYELKAAGAATEIIKELS